MKISVSDLAGFTSIYLDDSKVSQVNAGSIGLSFSANDESFCIKERDGRLCLYRTGAFVGTLKVLEKSEDYIAISAGSSIELTFEMD